MSEWRNLSHEAADNRGSEEPATPLHYPRSLRNTISFSGEVWSTALASWKNSVTLGTGKWEWSLLTLKRCWADFGSRKNPLVTAAYWRSEAQLTISDSNHQSIRLSQSQSVVLFQATTWHHLKRNERKRLQAETDKWQKKTRKKTTKTLCRWHRLRSACRPRSSFKHNNIIWHCI